MNEGMDERWIEGVLGMFVRVGREVRYSAAGWLAGGERTPERIIQARLQSAAGFGPIRQPRAYEQLRWDPSILQLVCWSPCLPKSVAIYIQNAHSYLQCK